ncbi:MAG: hypothetical protein ACR2GZ_07500 [Solirubrobacteraceae bacterium]
MTPSFLMVCASAAIAGAPPGWATATLRDGEVALLVDEGGVGAVNDAARALGQLAVSVVRREADPDAQEQTVIEFAGSLPLIWVTDEFSEPARSWAHDRGPMTLLIAAEGVLSEPERTRIGRFVTLLARQTD